MIDRAAASSPPDSSEALLTFRPYRQLTDNEIERTASIKDAGNALLEVLDVQSPGREISLAKTKVEEAVMWACKGVTG